MHSVVMLQNVEIITNVIIYTSATYYVLLQERNSCITIK